MENQQFKFCRMCGNQLKADAGFCRYCGYEFTNMAQQKQEPEPVKIQARVCDKCGNQVSQEAAFCKYCGVTLSENISVSGGLEATGSANGVYMGTQRNAGARMAPTLGAAQNANGTGMGTGAAQNANGAGMRTGAVRNANGAKTGTGTDTHSTMENATKPNGFARSTSKKQQKKKKKITPGWRLVVRFLCICLSIILVYEGIMYCFVDPGVLIRRGGDPDYPVVKTGGGSTNDDNIVATLENSPGNPRFLSVRYSKEEVEKAPSSTAEVSPSQLKVTAGNVEVELPPWNLAEEGEKLTVRELPKKTDGTTGEEIYGYDFSLSSGTHDLGTCALITIPRKAGDKEGTIVYYNQDTNEWEPTYYEVSEDGNSYLLYTNHFSIFGEKIGRMEEQYHLSDADFYGSCFKKVYGEDGQAPLHQERVTLDEIAFNKIISKPIEVEGMWIFKIFAQSPDMAKEKDGVAVLFSAGDAANNYVMGWGATVVNQITQTFTKVKHTLRFGAIGGGLTLAKIAYQFSQGKSTNNIIAENRADIVGTCITAMTAHAQLSGAELAASGLGWIGMAVFLGYKVYDSYALQNKNYSEFLPQDKYEAVAAYYNNTHATYDGKDLTIQFKQDTQDGDQYREWVYALNYNVIDDRPFFGILDGILEKNINDPEKFTKELDRFYQSFHEPFFLLSEEEQWNYIARLTGSEEEFKAFRESQFTYALSDDEKAELDGAVDHGFSRERMRQYLRGDEMDDGSGYKGMVQSYKYRTNQLALYCTRVVMEDLQNMYFVKAMEATKKSMYNEVLPVLNKTVSIEVIDERQQKAGLTFDKSPYANSKWYDEAAKIDKTLFGKSSPYSFVGSQKQFYDTAVIPMYFADMTAPGFYPTNVRDKSEYDPSTFVLHPTEGSNEVFCCRYFDYLAVGAPRQIVFNGDDSNPKTTASVTMEDGFGSNLFSGTIFLSSNKGDFIPLNASCPVSYYGLFDQTIVPDEGKYELAFKLDKEGNFTIHMDGILEQSTYYLKEAAPLDIRGKFSRESGEIVALIDSIGSGSLSYRTDETRNTNEEQLEIASTGGSNKHGKAIEWENSGSAVLGSDKGKIKVSMTVENGYVVLNFKYVLQPHHVELHRVTKYPDGATETEDNVYDSDSAYNEVTLKFKCNTGMQSYDWPE